eukprot:jgi/Mesvir1/15046/Mv14698-RA.2
MQALASNVFIWPSMAAARTHRCTGLCCTGVNIRTSSIRHGTGKFVAKARSGNLHNNQQHRRLSVVAQVSDDALDQEVIENTEYTLAQLEASKDRGHATEVVIIGSGIGGLVAGAMLARYGHKVTVCESHSVPGGAAHGFSRRGYKFDSGPSFFANMSVKPSSNPLKQALDILGEKVPCVTYDSWVLHLPEGKFTCVADANRYAQELGRFAGDEGLRQWKAIEAVMAPMAEGAASLPPAALRYDPLVAVTLGRFAKGLLKAAPVAGVLQGPFSNIVNKVVTNKFVRNLIDLECFVLSGLPANGTIAAEMAYMYGERNRPGNTLDYPLGGSEAVVKALIRGLEKHGGRLMTNAHVQEVLVESGRAVGVKLRGPKGSEAKGSVIRASKAVISNASVWDTLKLLPVGAVPDEYRSKSNETPQTESFVHLHLGINKTGLPEDMLLHYVIVNDWEKGVGAPQNVIIISIPSIIDPSLAPPGKHVIHAYTAGNEPYSIWEGLDRKSEAYKKLKEERSQVIWAALERVIPDIRSRVEVQLVGTPLTHERYLRRE